MAHGQDVANIGHLTGAASGTRAVLRRASAVIANSRWLGDRLNGLIPSVAGDLEVIDCGIDLSAFTPRSVADARRELGLTGNDPAFVCVGSLIERKNVLRLADAFERLGHGELTFVGDGPLRSRLEGRPRIRITGRIPQADVPNWIAASRVLCQPSLIEPFGQATLEGMAMERSVVATRVGGPPEFVTDEAGVLVDPLSEADLAGALERAATMPSPNPAARSAASEHDVVRQAARMAGVLERAIQGSG
jgi:glycosyltransferase involved in cell wall biosynthesis